MKSTLRSAIILGILGIVMYTSMAVQAAQPMQTIPAVPALVTPEAVPNANQDAEAKWTAMQRQAEMTAEYYEKNADRIIQARNMQRESALQRQAEVRQLRRVTPAAPRYGCTAEPYADLSWCDFSGANLKGKNLSGAILLGTDFSGANLTGAKLIAVQGVSANFASAILDNADFTSAQIDSASFYAASMKKTLLKGAVLVNSDFRRANMTQASLINTEIALSNLAQATMSDTIVRVDDAWPDPFDVGLWRVKSGGIVGTPQLQLRYRYCSENIPPGDDYYELCMRKYIVKNGYIIGPGVDLSYARLAGADLSFWDEDYYGCNYSDGARGILLNIDLSYADLRNSNLDCQDLSFADITGTQLSGASWYGLESGAVFGRPASLPTGVKLLRGGICCSEDGTLWYENVLVGGGANVSGYDFPNTDFRGIDLLGTSFYSSNLENANFSGMRIDWVMIGGSNLRQANFNNTDIGFLNIYGWQNEYGTGVSDATGATFHGAKVDSEGGLLILNKTDLTNVSLASLKIRGNVKIDNPVAGPADYPPGWRKVNNAFFGRYAYVNSNEYNYDTWEAIPRSFDDEDFSGMDLRDTQFFNLTFRNANFEGVNFQDTLFFDIDFNGANLRNTLWKSASLHNADFTNAQLQGAVFENTQGLTTVTWSNTTCPDGSNSDTLPGQTCLNNLSADMHIITAKAKVIQNEAVNLTIRRMQPDASYIVRYQNGNQLTSGTANSQGEATYQFRSNVIGAHNLEVVSNGSIARLTQYVEASPSNVAVPCTIESVRSINGFNNGLVYGDVKEVYDVVVKRGSAGSVTVQVYVNNVVVATQSGNASGSSEHIALRMDVPLNSGSALKRGHNTIRVVATGDNNCTSAFEVGQYVWSVPDFLVSGTLSNDLLDMELPLDTALQSVLQKPGEVLKIPNAKIKIPLEPIKLPAQIEGNKIKLKRTLQSTKWNYMGSEIELAIQADGELALWNPTNTQAAPDWGIAVTANGKSEITAFEHPLLPYVADLAAPGTSQVILAGLETMPPVKDWVSDRGELYVEVTPELELGVNAQGQGFTANELKFMFKGKIQMKAGVRSDLGIARFDASLGAGLASENTYYPRRTLNKFESKIKVPYSAEIMLEAFVFTYKQSYKGACTWTFESTFVLGDRACATEGSSIRRGRTDWQLADRPVARRFALPRALDDAVLYSLGNSHSASGINIAVIDDTQAVAVWEYDNTGDALGEGYDIRYSLWNGESWSTPAVITNDAYLDRAPSVSYLADGSILAVWERFDDAAGVGAIADPDDLSGQMGIMWSVYRGGAWSTPAWIVQPNGTNHIMPTVVSGDMGTWAFWQEYTGSLLSPESVQVMYSQFDDSIEQWDGPYAYTEAYSALDTVQITMINGSPAMSYRATTEENGTGFYVSTFDNGPIDLVAAQNAQRVQVIPGDNPYVMWQEGDALSVQPLSAVIEASGEGLVQQTNIFTNGLQLDEMVANQLPDGDLVLVVSGARGAQRDMSIVRYDQDTKQWGTPRTLTNNLDKESSITGQVSVDNTVFIGYRNDTVAMLPEIISGQTITVPTVVGTSMYVMRANLQRDVGITLSDPVVVAGAPMIPMTLQNNGDTFEQLDILLLNNMPADIGDLYGYVIKPGEKIVYNVPVSREELAAGIELIVGMLDGSDDNPDNDRAEYAAQVAQLDVAVQQILPRFDGSLDVIWQVSNPSLFDVSAVSNTLQLNGSDVFTETIDFIVSGESVARVHNMPASVVMNGDVIKAAVSATDPMEVSDVYTTTLTVNPQVRFMENSLQVTTKPATVKTSLINTGLAATDSNAFTVSVYDRLSNMEGPALNSVAVPALASGETFAVQLPVTYSKTPCGTFVVLKDNSGNVQQLLSQSVTNCADFMELRQGNSLYVWGFYDRSTMSGIKTWNWKFGDGSTSTVANPVKTYTKPGLYTVELTVSDGKNKVTGTRQIQVGPSSVELTQTAAVEQTATAVAVATARAAMTQTKVSMAQTAAVAKQQTADALATTKAGIAQTKAAAAQTVAAAKAQTATAAAVSKVQTAAPGLTAKAAVAETKAAAAQTAAAAKAQTSTAAAVSKAQTAAPGLTAKAAVAETKAAAAQTAAAAKAQTSTAVAVSKAQTAAPGLTAKAAVAETKAAAAQTATAAKLQTNVALAPNSVLANKSFVTANQTTTTDNESRNNESADVQMTATIQTRWLQATRTMRRDETDTTFSQTPAYIQWLSNR